MTLAPVPFAGPALAELLDVPSFQELVKGFVELYKVGIKVLDARGGRIADVSVGSGDFCASVFSTPEGRARCTETVALVKEGPLTVHPIHTVRCFTGLRYLSMPILWEGALLGRIVFGPFVPEEPDVAVEGFWGLEPDKLKEAVAKIRRAPEATVAKVVLHFGQVVETLVAAGEKAHVASRLHLESMVDANRELESKNRTLEGLNERLKELDRLKSMFLAMVSHELRTPLTSIIGYSEMLAEGSVGALSSEQGEYVATIMEKGETLLRLISSLLDAGQIEAGKLRVVLDEVVLEELVLFSLASLVPQAKKKGVQLTWELPAESARVWVDRAKLDQVVVNLVANAVKFTPAGGGVRVTLSELGPQPELGQAGYRIVVKDSGVGIAREHFDKIFGSFYQVDNSSTREHGGVGIGLAIVKSFVEGHGGRILVESEPGQGSQFTAVLPVRPESGEGRAVSEGLRPGALAG